MMGNVNQVGPTGSLTHEQSGTFNWRDPFTGQSYDIPTFTARTELSPDQQALFDQNTRTQQGLGALAETQTGRLQNTLGRDFSPDSLPDFGRIPGADDYSADRQRVEAAIMERMAPQMAADREAMESRLANQGIGMGARAYSAAQDDFGRNVNDARLGSILAGGQEQSRMQGLAMQAAGMQDGQRAQSLQEQLAMRNQPINEITALLSGSQVSMPNFQANQPAGIPTTDTAGLINQNFAQRHNNYNSQMDQWDSTMGGLFGMGAALISDERAKEGKRRVGETNDGLPIYTYRYKGDDTTQMGVMAQDVQKKNPKAVKRMGDLLAVDYRGVR